MSWPRPTGTTRLPRLARKACGAFSRSRSRPPQYVPSPTGQIAGFAAVCLTATLARLLVHPSSTRVHSNGDTQVVQPLLYLFLGDAPLQPDAPAPTAAQLRTRRREATLGVQLRLLNSFLSRSTAAARTMPDALRVIDLATAGARTRGGCASTSCVAVADRKGHATPACNGVHHGRQPQRRCASSAPATAFCNGSFAW